MEAFEHVVSVVLQNEGFTVSTNVKFAIERQTRRRDRPEFQKHGYEIDIVAARHDKLILGEVKSYFGSTGLVRDYFVDLGSNSPRAKKLQARLKILNEPELRSSVLREARRVYGYPLSKTWMVLFVGRFGGGTHEQDIRRHVRGIRVANNPVKVVGLQEIAAGLAKAARAKTYIDDPVVMTAKVLGAAGALLDEHGSDTSLGL